MNMSSLKNSLRSKKSKKKSSQPIRFIDLSPVIEKDEDAAEVLRDRILERQRQRRVGEGINEVHNNSLDNDNTHKPRRSPPRCRDSHYIKDDGDGNWGNMDDFTPPFSKDLNQAVDVYNENTQNAINDFVESANVQRMEEQELLNRAIERREMLHNRITAIEVAKAEFDTSSSNHLQEKERKKSKKQKKQPASPDRPFDEARQSRKRSGRKNSSSSDYRRMGALSEKIKKEASDFMNFESKFTEQHLFEGNGTQENFADQYLFDNEKEESRQTEVDSNLILNAGHDENKSNLVGFEDDDSSYDSYDNATVSDSNESDAQLSTLIEEDSQSSASDALTIHSTDSNMDSALSGAPTPSQLSRYSNMVRLGIPDVAVLRSMERDEITNPASVLRSLKKDGDAQQTPAASARSSSVSPRRTMKKVNGRVDQSSSSSNNNTVFLGGDDRVESNERPLRDDPNYTKYFKMLKAKVPRSWVKRVLEVDGRDARILRLDPDRPLSEQVSCADVDDEGNIDWKNVAIDRIDSMDTSDSEGEEKPTKAIPMDIGASVKAELAAMTARAGEFARKRSAGSDGQPMVDRTQHSYSSTPADISSAVIAASNARLNRLKALRVTSDDADSSLRKLGRRRDNVDEIRRRAPPPSKPPRFRRSSTSSVTSSGGGSTDQSYDRLPLKVSGLVFI